MPQRYLLKGLAPAEADEALQRERALLYVAASRARDVLVVSVVGGRLRSCCRDRRLRANGGGSYVGSASLAASPPNT